MLIPLNSIASTSWIPPTKRVFLYPGVCVCVCVGEIASIPIRFCAGSIPMFVYWKLHARVFLWWWLQYVYCRSNAAFNDGHVVMYPWIDPSSCPNIAAPAIFMVSSPLLGYAHIFHGFITVSFMFLLGLCPNIMLIGGFKHLLSSCTGCHPNPIDSYVSRWLKPPPTRLSSDY